uniref:Uncharacterized protein n=1 Tax=Chrysotila carterae TaxID=13221 RepID=A0A7S4F321_CHRCT
MRGQRRVCGARMCARVRACICARVRARMCARVRACAAVRLVIRAFLRSVCARKHSGERAGAACVTACARRSARLPALMQNGATTGEETERSALEEMLGSTAASLELRS